MAKHKIRLGRPFNFSGPEFYLEVTVFRVILCEIYLREKKMKLKKIVKMLLVGSVVVALAACSSTGKRKPGSMGGGYGADGAQTSGLGDNSEFSDQGGMGSQSMSKRIYYFDFDKSDVREEDKAAIFANADYLVAHPNARITVEGHTDPRGSREYNVALGEHRAKAVAELIESKGVGPAQIHIVSYGAQKLAVPGHTDSDYQLDRRAVIVYLQK